MTHLWCIADLHLHEWREGARPLGAGDPLLPPGLSAGCNSRLAAQVAAVQRVCAKAAGKGDLCLFLGDMVHNRAGATPHVVEAANACLAAMNAAFEKTWLIPGNHDHSAKAGGADYISALVGSSGEFPRLHVATQPELVTSQVDGGLQLALVPWTPDPKAFAQAVRDLAARLDKDGGMRVLGAHVGVNGARLNDAAFQRHAEVGVDDLMPDAWDCVFLGDYHYRQTVPGTRNVFYVGSFTPHNWGDAGQHKGALVKTLLDSSVPILVPSNAPGFREEIAATAADLKGIQRKLAKDRAAGSQDIVRVATVAGLRPDVEALSELGAALIELPPDKIAPAGDQAQPLALDSTVAQVVDAYLEGFEALLVEGGTGVDDSDYHQFVADVREAMPELMRDFDEAAAAPVSLRLLRVEAEHFLSYRKLGPVPLDRQGAIFLDGRNEDDPSAVSNGAGKTTLLDAVFYLLFGHTTRFGRGVQSLRRRWSKRGEHPVARGAVVVPGGTLEIERGPKVGLNLALNGKSITPANPQEAQALLQGYLGVSRDLFRRLCLFGGDGLVGATDAERKEALESLTGAARFEELRAKATAAIKERAAALEKARRESDDWGRRLVSLDERRADVAKSVEEYGAAVEDKAAAMERLADEMAAGAAELRAKAVAGDVAKLEGEWQAVKARRDELAGKRASAEQLASSIEAARRKLERGSLTAALEIDRLEKVAAGGTCPTCGAPVKASGCLTELSEARETKATLDERMVEVKADAEKAAKALKALEGEALAQREAEGQVKARYDAAKAARREAADCADRAEAKEREAAALREKARAHRKADNPHLATLANIDKQRVDAGAAQAAAEHDAELAAVERRRYENAAVALGPKGARGRLLATLAPAIEAEANAILEAMSAGTMRVSFSYDVETEKLSLEADNAQGADAMAGNSGGQRRKLSLALAWALHRQVSGSVGALFLDEAFDALDSEAATRAAAYLGSLAEKSLGTVIVISHRPELGAGFSRTWTARLKGHQSTLELDAAANA